MKPLVTWVAVAVVAFAVLAGGYHYHLGENPRTVVIIVDSSFPMRGAWERLPALFESLGDRPYTRYRVVTDKGRVDEFDGAPRVPGAAPYAPRRLANLADPAFAKHLAGAEQVYLVTNAPDGEIPDLPGVEVVRP